ncbi:hypothetical protein Hypma_012636 [Hypsizygus marmoreus]|uniref:Uncharacterized protein n=1 Tax=Hypsizygus marmoreus TaxID=39966 RepID=A0A369JDU7_HYPMA|nr:hypothetical protein Hypma_012636 [Hypsizygus marmoreus]
MHRGKLFRPNGRGSHSTHNVQHSQELPNGHRPRSYAQDRFESPTLCCDLYQQAHDLFGETQHQKIGAAPEMCERPDTFASCT